MYEKTKEPSELDITLLRDLCDKFFFPPNPDDRGWITTNLTVPQMQARKDALLRLLNHYEHMSDEISRLVLEKHRID